MGLSTEQTRIITALVASSLDAAEKVWEEHQPVFEAATEAMAMDSIAKRAEVAPSRIPDHPFVSSDQAIVAEYVCLVADMRDSSKHLMVAHSSSRPTFTEMKRVYFETAALLPALDQTIQFEDGSVTEYLGDGILGLFSVNEEDRGHDIKRAYRAAKNCIGDTRTIVNEALTSRYELPELDLGVGLGFGNAIIQLVGVPSRMHPKAIGPCVYHATKLSVKRNEILISEPLRLAWPKSKGGKLKFSKVTAGDVAGYRIG